LKSNLQTFVRIHGMSCYQIEGSCVGHFGFCQSTNFSWYCNRRLSRTRRSLLAIRCSTRWMNWTGSADLNRTGCAR
jgi:hypothetical protein